MARRTSTNEQVQAAYLEALPLWDEVEAEPDTDTSIPALQQACQEQADLHARYTASMRRIDEIERQCHALLEHRTYHYETVR